MTIDGTQQGETVVKVFSFTSYSSIKIKSRSRFAFMRWLFLLLCTCTWEDVEWRYSVTKEGKKCIIEDLDWVSRSRGKHKNILMKYFESEIPRWCQELRNERIFVNWQTFSRKKVKELLRSIFELSFILKRASFDCTSSCEVLLAYLIVLLHFSSSSFWLFVQLIHSFIYDNKRERKRIHTYSSETHFEGVLFTHQAALQQQKRENSLQSSHLIDFFFWYLLRCPS